VQKSVDETEKAVHMVNQLSLFATNEDIEEVATSDLRFLFAVYILFNCCAMTVLQLWLLILSCFSQTVDNLSSFLLLSTSTSSALEAGNN